MPLTAGTRLGVYEIRSLLGAGGMGEVYRGALDGPCSLMDSCRMAHRVR
jgi:hypothetical protein